MTTTWNKPVRYIVLRSKISKGDWSIVDRLNRVLAKGPITDLAVAERYAEIMEQVWQTRDVKQSQNIHLERSEDGKTVKVHILDDVRDNTTVDRLLKKDLRYVVTYQEKYRRFAIIDLTTKKVARYGFKTRNEAEDAANKLQRLWSGRKLQPKLISAEIQAMADALNDMYTDHIMQEAYGPHWDKRIKASFWPRPE